jgi:hypothetical protein
MPHANAFEPALRQAQDARQYGTSCFYLYAQGAPGFLRSPSAKNETQKEDKVPLRMITFGSLYKPCTVIDTINYDIPSYSIRP